MSWRQVSAQFRRLFGAHVVAFTLVAIVAHVVIATPTSTNATLRLDFSVNGKHAPFFLGVEKGFYASEGINLEILEGKGSLSTVQLIANRTNTFGFPESTATIIVAASGTPLKMVASFQQRTPTAAISFKPMSRPTDLYDKTVGLNPLGVGTLWQAFVAKHKLDLGRIRVITLDGPSLLPALLVGRLDAIIGLVNAEGAAASVLTGTNVYMVRFADFGVNTVAHGILVHQATIDQNPDLVRRFVAASVRAWTYALGHREEAIDALVKRFPEAKREIIKKQFEFSVPLLHSINTQGKPIGWMAEENWKATLDILKEFGGLKTDLVATNFFTNDFLPRK